ncbi:GAF and ANTAR domain-containing protein [Streptomyces sp. NPDC054842]
MDERLLARTFVELADNLAADFDLMDFLRMLADRCVGMLDASAAGVLLADRRGRLGVMAASDEQVRRLGVFEVRSDDGPCLQCFRSGAPVTVPDLSERAVPWPDFAEAARLRGFGAVQALPMRLRDETVGALALFRATPGGFDCAATSLAQALADVATISLLQHRSTHRSTVLNEQLQTALDSRVLIEQAKGKLAERQGSDPEQAFTALRRYARAHNRRLADLAQAFVSGSEPFPGLGLTGAPVTEGPAD